MRVIEYRNKDGYVIERKPFVKRKDRMRIAVRAMLVRCPDTDHLRAVRFCDSCPMFGRYGSDGVECESTAEYVLDWHSKVKVKANTIIKPRNRYESGHNKCSDK